MVALLSEGIMSEQAWGPSNFCEFWMEEMPARVLLLPFVT